jgi:hypothetical protein
MPRSLEIERINSPKPEEFFSTHVAVGQPAIITGQMDWPLLGCDPSKIMGAEKDVFVSQSRSGLYGPSPIGTRALPREVLQFGKLLEHWDRKHPRPYYYMDQQPIKALHPELLEMITIPQFIDPDLLVAANLWLGEGGLRWHFDGVDNFLAHVCGEKKIRLIAPEHLTHMYPFGAQWSAIDDIDNVDYSAFPMASNIEFTLDATLRKGDMLFIPAGWWHSTKVVNGWAASVNFWYQSWCGCPKSVFERPLFSLAQHLTHILAQEVPVAERRHYCRYIAMLLERIANGQALPEQALWGWDNPDRLDFTPVEDRVPPRFVSN